MLLTINIDNIDWTSRNAQWCLGILPYDARLNQCVVRLLESRFRITGEKRSGVGIRIRIKKEVGEGGAGDVIAATEVGSRTCTPARQPEI